MKLIKEPQMISFYGNFITGILWLFVWAIIIIVGFSAIGFIKMGITALFG